ncbi:hypothetical protein HDU76_013357 [Blyttiomyces sp. JEL0837]|nr:hypothetical protein HDU76_013357 [Blyttiomyces sp. JEL0837]
MWGKMIFVSRVCKKVQQTTSVDSGITCLDTTGDHDQIQAIAEIEKPMTASFLSTLRRKLRLDELWPQARRTDINDLRRRGERSVSVKRGERSRSTTAKKLVLREVISGYHNSNPEAKIAVKVIYDAPSPTEGPSTEVSILRHLSLNTTTPPHDSIIQYIDDWYDPISRFHYLVTAMAGTVWNDANTHDDFDDEDRDTDEDLPPLIFANTRLSRIENLSVSFGSTDLYAWSVNQLLKRMKTSGQPIPPPLEPTTYKKESQSLPLPPVSSAHSIFAQVSSAVHHLHSNGFYHGDIKEENVLIQSCSNYPSGLRAVLADFGHAGRVGEPSIRPRSNNTEKGMEHYGTPEMTSPEYLLEWQNRNNNVNPTNTSTGKIDLLKADIYALGVLLFSLRHGPGEIPTASRAMADHLTSGMTKTCKDTFHATLTRSFSDAEWSSLDRLRYSNGRSNDDTQILAMFGINGNCCNINQMGSLQRYVGCDVTRTYLSNANKMSTNANNNEDPYFYFVNDLDPRIEDECVDLLRGMLHPDPRRRFSIEQVVSHPWVCGRVL